MSRPYASEGPSKGTRGKKKLIDIESERKKEMQETIAKEVAEIVPIMIAAIKATEHSVGGEESNGGKRKTEDEFSGTHSPKKEKKTVETCTYRAFQGCKPQDFSRDEGAVAALRWLEKMESVIAVSKCAREDRIVYATNSFKDEALEW